jgi:hypothetical protein
VYLQILAAVEDRRLTDDMIDDQVWLGPLLHPADLADDNHDLRRFAN